MMGGNAIAKARRISKDEYDKIIKHIEGQGFYTTVEETPDCPLHGITIYGTIVKSYRLKEDFGDIDIVIDDRVDIVDLFRHFRPKKCAVNGNVMSISYDGIQVDFIRTPKEYIQSTLDYFAYNDLGNLLGKIARSLGFKYGNKGLIYQHKDEKGNVIEDITVTADLEEILTVFGLNYFHYQQGFDALEDIFKFVTSSRFFSPELYALENATAANRIRDSKRKTYTLFLEWLEKHTFERDSFAAAKRNIRQECVFETYPHIQKRIDEISKERNEDKLLRSYISGMIVSELTGLTGTELGKFIELFRSLNPRDELLKLTMDECRERIVHTFNFLQQQALQEKIEGII